ncbi:tetratricopeptide repeat protein [Microbacterium gorillae]|uniref:tetratricopeptide repeat protein n=1 Tax=Microbacterium gorillae TaxID=1231063 RepID=UPI000694A9C3|nr:tetratricopeptide repeat protein [Microbacterium gorillae]
MEDVLDTARATAEDHDATANDVLAAAIALDEALQQKTGRSAEALPILVTLYTRAGEAGLVDGWIRLARLHGPHGISPTPAVALAASERAAESGEPTAVAEFVRAVRAAPVELAEPLYAEAAEHLNAALVQHPDPDLMVLSAFMLADGQGYAADPAQARQVLEAAAAAGSADAHFELYVYDMTGATGPEDRESAISHLRAAAHGGNHRAMANLGAMYATGDGVEADEDSAVAWYRRAADAGNARAAFNLAIMFSTGDGAPKDRRLAQHYRRIAADRGLAN